VQLRQVVADPEQVEQGAVQDVHNEDELLKVPEGQVP